MLSPGAFWLCHPSPDARGGQPPALPRAEPGATRRVLGAGQARCVSQAPRSAPARDRWQEEAEAEAGGDGAEAGAAPGTPGPEGTAGGGSSLLGVGALGSAWSDPPGTAAVCALVMRARELQPGTVQNLGAWRCWEPFRVLPKPLQGSEAQPPLREATEFWGPARHAGSAAPAAPAAPMAPAAPVAPAVPAPSHAQGHAAACCWWCTGGCGVHGVCVVQGL